MLQERRFKQVPEIDKLKEIVDLQARLWKAVQRMPEGAERQKALREIGGFQNRMAALVGIWFGNLGAPAG